MTPGPRPPLRQLTWIGLALGLLVLQCTACGVREPERRPFDDATGASSTIPSGPAPERQVPRPRQTLDQEPELGVLLAQGPRVAFILLLPGRLADGTPLAPGRHLAEVGPGGLLLDARPLGPQARIRVPGAEGAARFSGTLVPPFGQPQRLDFAGEPALALSPGGEVQLIERVGLETYLAGVVPTEMNPSWPAAALEAQAIVARSYAAAKWLLRQDRPWQLHWHFTEDMAYAGRNARPGAAGEAVRRTRGRMLLTGGVPVTALFHASTGGRGEAAANAFPGLKLADGRSAAPCMPGLADPDCEAGCNGLRLLASHWRWKQDLPLAEVTRGLQAWSRQASGRARIGTVTGVLIASRHADSGRVAELEVQHRLDGRSRSVKIPATEFRLAVGPGDMRSTWLDRCLVVPAKGGTLVLAGRGFGHGVGLSQVSAWQMARDGRSADEIVARFYAGSVIGRKY